MQDRVSATPGRMLITPENGQPAFYATVKMADNPTVEGTPLNKANLLTDATAALYGLGTDAVPDKAFAKLKTLVDTAQSTGDSKVRIVSGSYTGDNTESRKISLPFTPLAIILGRNGIFYSPEYNIWSGLADKDNPLIAKYSTFQSDALVIKDSGFIVSYNANSKCYTNVSDNKYVYIAWG